MLQLRKTTLIRGRKKLLEQVNLLINSGEKIGIVGSNGAGKTSLFKLIKGELECDNGACELTNELHITEIQQTIPSGTQSALEYVLYGNSELASIYQQLQLAEKNNNGLKIAELHLRLQEIDGYSAESRAAKILLGLGFQQAELKQSIDDFSGGWRMRLNLARALLQPSDLLLLDEPTNHLDLEAIFWLENWLSELSQTFLIISHDREFLDHVVKRIIFLKDGQLLSFTGNYSYFEEQYASQLEQQQATFLKQQRQMQHLQGFVDRFRYKASKAKQAQSRLKMIARIEKVAAVRLTIPFNFSFKAAPPAGDPMISLKKVDIGYENKIILNDVNLSIHPGDRLAFIGPNGAGKSTLIKALARKIPVMGDNTFNPKIKFGYFTQHQLETLHLHETPLWHLTQLDPHILEKQARQFLGSFNFSDECIFSPISDFSGGEKARLALALLIWQQPNLLLLDEPSNHLDLEMREALTMALQNYNGALLLITHDRYLLKSLANELYLVADHQVAPFVGDLDDYQAWFIQHQEKSKNTKPKKVKEVKNKTNNWAKKLEKLEKLLDKDLQQLTQIETNLSDVNLYNDPTRQEERKNTEKSAEQLRYKIEQLEAEIFIILEHC